MEFYNCYTIMAGQDSCRFNCLDDDQDPRSQLRCLWHIALRCNDTSAIGDNADFGQIGITTALPSSASRWISSWILTMAPTSTPRVGSSKNDQIRILHQRF